MVEKRRSLQAKKQRLLQGLETLMKMAPDVVAQRSGGTNDDDWLAHHGSDGAALLQQGNGRCVGDKRLNMQYAVLFIGVSYPFLCTDVQLRQLVKLMLSMCFIYCREDVTWTS